MEQPRRHLEQDLRLRIAAHSAKHRRELAVAGRQRRRKGVRRPTSGCQFSGVPIDQVEPQPTVVEVDACGGFDEVGAETGGIRLDQ